MPLTFSDNPEIDRLYRLTYGVQASLSPDLLSPKWRKLLALQTGRHPLTGHCYVASEALYHLGARDAGYEPMVASALGITHWWLRRRSDGAILDPTWQQFDKSTLQLLWTRGRYCGFLTKQPSKRAQVLIERVRNR